MPASGTVLLTRHGESEHNLNTRLYMGRSPQSRLTALGQEQAVRLGRHLAATRPISAIVASSLPRTVETAEIIAHAVGIASVHTDDAFWELSKGEWEGRMPRDGVPPDIRQAMANDPVGFQFPGGESFARVAERVVPAFTRWTAHGAAVPMLFVLHGDVICALLHHLLRFPDGEIHNYLVRPCSLTELSADGGSYRLVNFNQEAP